jgi:NDP-sugar pyrophosphorylase family protein
MTTAPNYTSSQYTTFSDDNAIKNDACVAANCFISKDDCLLGSNVVVERHSVIKESCIGPNTKICSGLDPRRQSSFEIKQFAATQSGETIFLSWANGAVWPLLAYLHTGSTPLVRRVDNPALLLSTSLRLAKLTKRS